MFDNPTTIGLVKFIKLLSDKYKEDICEKDLIELRDRMDLCIQEMLFWMDRKNLKRYEYSLRSFSSWLIKKLDKKKKP